MMKRQSNKMVGGAIMDFRTYMKENNKKYNHITYDHAMSVTG